MRPQAFLTTLLASQAVAYPTLDPRSWPSVNAFFTALEKVFPPLGVAVTDVCSVITHSEALLSAVFNVPDQPTGTCGDVTFLFCRGTCDAGSTGIFAAPWLFHSLQGKLNGKTLGTKAVNYPASVDGFLTGGIEGGQEMAKEIKQVIQDCPNSKIVIGGHSQGAEVVHNAAANLDADTMSKISAVVLFGDPKDGQPVANIDNSKVKTVCHPTDNICQGGDIILLSHITYGEDADSAADFVISKLG